MLIPEWLFRLTPRDEQVTPIEIVNHTTSTGSAATTVTSFDDLYTVPKGKVLLVTSIGLGLQGGAGQTPLGAYVQAFPAGSSTEAVTFYGRNITPTASVQGFDATFDGGVFLPEDYYVYATSKWSAGANSNTLRFSMGGILIPRGNIAI